MDDLPGDMSYAYIG